jgi:hypothetical protein
MAMGDDPGHAFGGNFYEVQSGGRWLARGAGGGPRPRTIGYDVEVPLTPRIQLESTVTLDR